MTRLIQALTVAGYNFSHWRKNPRVLLTFALALILCFLLSDKAVQFSQQQGTLLQLVEPFVWAFGDSDSILFSSQLLVLLFSDLPFLSPATPYYLIRMDRKTWLLGQVLYVLGGGRSSIWHSSCSAQRRSLCSACTDFSCHPNGWRRCSDSPRRSCIGQTWRWGGSPR